MRCGAIPTPAKAGGLSRYQMTVSKQDILLAVRVALQMHKTTRVVLDSVAEETYLMAVQGFEPEAISIGLDHARMFSREESQLTPKGIAEWCKRATVELANRRKREDAQHVAGELMASGESDMAAKINQYVAQGMSQAGATRQVIDDCIDIINGRVMRV